MIDRIYYINLDKREDRNEHMVNMLTECGLIDISGRISAIYNDIGYLGCCLSHIKAVEEFINSGMSTCIILEDDFFIKESGTFISDIQKVFDNYIDYDIIQLSGNHFKLELCEENWLRRVYNSQASSGYIITKEFAPILLKNYKESCEFLKQGKERRYYSRDQYWKKLQPISKWYCFYPPIGHQMKSYSDIEKRIRFYGC
jgi:hypothetical protein